MRNFVLLGVFVSAALAIPVADPRPKPTAAASPEAAPIAAPEPTAMPEPQFGFDITYVYFSTTNLAPKTNLLVNPKESPR
jgi:hypothetical protein